MIRLVAFLFLLVANAASAQTLPQVIIEINTVLPSGSALTAANVRTVLNFMAGANSLTSGLTSTINANLPSGSALSAAPLRTTLQAFTSALGLSTQLNSYINGNFASSDPAGISAAGLRVVLINLANNMFGITQFALPSGDVLHYMAATGCNDTNNGTSPATPWCTANHPLNCGDVIIAAKGTYNGNFNRWGVISNCPSTTGGIDGAGGIWAAVLLCGGSDLGANGCNINCATGACATGLAGAVSAVMQNNANNWAVIGWTGNGNATGRGYQMDVSTTCSTITHHNIFINDIIVNANQGFGMDGGACPFPDTNGPDYAAVVGGIAQNAALDSICLGALDFVGPANFDALAGTHLYAYGNFVFSAFSSPCITISDSEGILLDTLDVRGFSGQVVVANNAVWNNMRSCIVEFFQNYTAAAPIIKIYNNTCYNNNINVGNDGAGTEINVLTSNRGGAGLGIGLPWITTIQNNIARNTHDLSDSTTHHNFALISGGGPPASQNMTIGGSGTQNILRGASTVSIGSCDSTNSACQFNGNSFGTNTYVDPQFANTADLNANWLGLPSCTGFVSVTHCMGYNVLTSTLTVHTPIADLQAGCTQCGGKGYQLPSMNCNTNADYPAYLKGLNRLQLIQGTTTIIQVHDLATAPCGM